LEQIQRRLFRDVVVLLGVPRVDLGDGIQVTPATGSPRASVCATWISSVYMLAT
jgi:hypothetical protein